jgi:hypothetical protein
MSAHHGGPRRLLGGGLSSRVSQFATRSFIKSIQRGTIAIAGGSVTNTATITSVNLACAYVVWLGVTTTDTTAEPDRDWTNVVLTNATTVTATRQSSVFGTSTVSFEVIEFVPGVLKSLQTGTITIATSAATGTATLPIAVTTTKAQVIMGGWLSTQTDQTGQNASTLPTLDLTNTTTVTATRATASASFTVTVGYTVIEWF